MIKVYFDGAFSISTGTMGLGAVVKQGRKIIYTHHEEIKEGGVTKLDGKHTIIKETSNNVSEYLSCIKAVEYLIKFHPKEEIEIYGDSQLVINQMNGLWRIKEGAYAPYAKLLRELIWKLKSPKFIWIPRSSNAYADLVSRGEIQ